MNSDVIHVLEKGKVAESGAFKELRKYKGHQIEED
jgi:ABC-type multidrug transport system fused ATPase/permease subunit